MVHRDARAGWTVRRSCPRRSETYAATILLTTTVSWTLRPGHSPAAAPGWLSSLLRSESPCRPSFVRIGYPECYESEATCEPEVAGRCCRGAVQRRRDSMLESNPRGLFVGISSGDSACSRCCSCWPRRDAFTAISQLLPSCICLRRPHSQSHPFFCSPSLL
ncbi:hypothetical protein OH76DRAFT_700247 [Lentinus brumalis]|uniref:Uncharacterized protein n=1 Tax=Lentinus brumalis TaxID=2498619 RepID=A0A371CH21_9APHY|nr:hypothetical protein OH76DRAFT_700247 [Polyporus brumalis]